MLASLALVALLAVTWFGAVKASRVFLAGEHGQFIFTPLGSTLYLGACVFTFLFYLFAERAVAGPGPIGALPIVILIPLLALPIGAYMAALIVELCSGVFSQSSSQGEHRSYDKGDAALQRGDPAAAVEHFRADLKCWPGDTEAVLRLARALEAAGQPDTAAAELSAARLDLLNRPNDEQEAMARPAISGAGGQRRDRNERILVLTMALGDLFAGPLNKRERARLLYEETLQRLYGYPNVDALRKRLQALSGATSIAPAATGVPVPERLTLD